MSKVSKERAKQRQRTVAAEGRKESMPGVPARKLHDLGAP